MGANVRPTAMVDKWNTADGRKVRLQCWRRDKAANAPCWICKDPIDYTLKPSSHPDAWEPDHYLDRKKHPELALDPNNIRASHCRCNRSRQAKAGLANLGNQSRDWSNIY